MSNLVESEYMRKLLPCNFLKTKRNNILELFYRYNITERHLCICCIYVTIRLIGFKCS